MTGIREYLRPASIEDAWAELSARGEAARPIGGGIDVHLYVPPGTTVLVDLTQAGLSYVREEDGVVIGATATFTQIRESTAGESYLGGVLRDVLARVASPLQRNLGTVGGTLGSAHPWSDVIPLLLVLDASVVVYDGARRTESVADYLAGRAAGERPLLVEVRLPPAAAGSACAFEKFAATGFDVATLNCACFATVRAGRCEAARIAVGGTPGLAVKLADAEGHLMGQRWNPKTIARAAAAAAAAIDARDDRRATAAYRRKLAQVGVARCLRRICAEGGGTE